MLFTSEIVRISRFNRVRQAVLVLTKENIYLFDADNLERRHSISNMTAIIKSSINTEAVFVFPDSKDLRFSGLSSQRLKEIQDLIQLCYVNKRPKKTLLIFGVPQTSLRDFSLDKRNSGV